MTKIIFWSIQSKRCHFTFRFQDHLPSILASFRPDLVLYDAGVDVHAKDDLGRLNLTDEGIMDRDLNVLRMCKGMVKAYQVIKICKTGSYERKMLHDFISGSRNVSCSQT